MQSDSIIRTRMKQKKSAIPVRVSAWLENMKQKHAEAEKMGKNRRSKNSQRATGGRLRKKRQAHRDSLLLTTVLCLKCRSLCTKKYSCVGLSTPKKNKRTEERHKNSGGESEKRKYRTERVNLQREREINKVCYRRERELRFSVCSARNSLFRRREKYLTNDHYI